MQSEESFKHAVGCDVCKFCQKGSGINCQNEKGFRSVFGGIKCANRSLEVKNKESENKNARKSN